MDVQEFKNKYPHLAHLEGNALWDAMENAWIYENPTPIIIKDWMGNEIQAGDEVCFIKTRTGSPFKNAAILMPNISGGYTKIEIPDEPEEDCWEVGRCMKIENINNSLMFTTHVDEYTMRQHISMLQYCIPYNSIMAIKGKSDTRPNAG